VLFFHLKNQNTPKYTVRGLRWASLGYCGHPEPYRCVARRNEDQRYGKSVKKGKGKGFRDVDWKNKKSELMLMRRATASV